MDRENSNNDELKQLSDCLNKASSLINTILEQPHNGNNPSERELERRQPEQSRQIALDEARASNPTNPLSRPANQHASVVASAVNRARLMIQQSSSQGLYSRLGKKERLRATKTSESMSKKPRIPEKPKLFEFVLLTSVNGLGQETVVFEDSMIVLRGFVEISKTASESDIRGKLGEAIRIKYPIISDTDFYFVRANRRRISRPVSVGEYNFQQVKLLAGQGSLYLMMKDGFDCVLVDDQFDDKFDFEKEGREI